MNRKILITSAILILALGPLATSPAFGEIAAVKTDNAEIDIGGMVQLLGFGQRLDDPYKDDNRLYLFMNRARLRLSGHYDSISFYSELGLGGEASIVAQTGVSLSLLDFAFNIPLLGSQTTYLKVGQFKVPYGREQLAYEGNLQFADRSINNLGFVVGRDVGAAVVSHAGLMTVIGGIFTGGGRDVPPNHYLPERLGIPLLVVRAGVGNVDGDPFMLTQDDTGTPDRRIKGALFFNALYTKDSLIGHSTVLNVKLADKSLLLDGDWNPYIGHAPLEQGTWWQAGADAAVRIPLRAIDLSGETAFDIGRYSNSVGAVQMWGARAQAGASYRSFALAIRYAYLVPDSRFAYMGVPLTGSEAIRRDHPQRDLVHQRTKAQAARGSPAHHPRPGLHRDQRR